MGVPLVYALRAMLISVVGVGAHWLNLPMHLLHVQCMVNFSQIMALLSITLDLQCTTCMISYTLHIILLYVHLNEHTHKSL